MIEAGLGLDIDTLRLVRATPAWIAAGEQLREQVAAELVGLVADVEQIGSSATIERPTPRARPTSSAGSSAQPAETSSRSDRTIPERTP